MKQLQQNNDKFTTLSLTITYQEDKVKKRKMKQNLAVDHVQNTEKSHTKLYFIYLFKKTTFYNEMPLQQTAAKVM